MFGHDKLLCKCMFSAAAVLMVYYLVWVVGLPFMDEDSFLRPYFPDPVFAVIAPTVILVCLLTLTGVYIIRAFWNEHRIAKHKE